MATASGPDRGEPDAAPSGSTPAGVVAPDAAPGADPDAGGDPEAVLGYRAELRLWLERHKRYPPRLRRRRIEGEVVVAFTVGAGGELLEHEVLESSGERGLDEAALAMLRAAEPLPPIPASMGVDRYRAEMPVRYALR